MTATTPEAQPNGSTAALEGLRVLDLTDETGVFAGRLLADAGADVVLVEPPGGSRPRHLAPFLDRQRGLERGVAHLSWNAGKRSITIDLATEGAPGPWRALLATADVVLETPRADGAPKLCFEDLTAINPRAVLVSITPFGLDTPWTSRRGGDLVVAAASGLLALSGDPGHPPVLAGGDQCFKLGGIAAATAALVGIVGRGHAAGGRGAHLDVSLQRCAAFSTLQMASPNALLWEGVVPGRQTSLDFPVFRCADGRWVSARLGFGDRWADFRDWAIECGIEVPFGPDDGPLAMALPPGSQFRQGKAADLIEAVAATMDRDTFLERAAQVDMICMPVQTFADLATCEQLLAVDTFSVVPHAPLGTLLGFPRSALDGLRRGEPFERAPLLGEHDDEIWTELGLDPAALRDQAVIQR